MPCHFAADNGEQNKSCPRSRLLHYTAKQSEDVAEEIYRPREDKQKLHLESAGRDELRKRIADMSAFLREQPIAITEYDEPLVRRLIEKVTVYEDKFAVEFKSGVAVDVNEQDEK